MGFSKGGLAVLLVLAIAQPFAAPGFFASANSRMSGARRTLMAANVRGSGDPLIQAFDGSLFFFHGEPGKIYNLASFAGGFQVNALLKEANNAVHIGSDKNVRFDGEGPAISLFWRLGSTPRGTYMETIGFQQDNVKVSAATYADDSSRMVVKVNGETLDLSEASVARTIGAVSITFKNFEANMGTVLTIRSPLVSVAVNLVPPGLDKAGYWQASYVNVDLTLLAAPTSTLQGVIGDTFHYEGKIMSAASVDANDKVPVVGAYTDLVYPVFPDMTYEVPTLFAQQNITFTADFIHEVIMMRKAAAAKLAAVVSVA